MSEIYPQYKWQTQHYYLFISYSHMQVSVSLENFQNNEQILPNQRKYEEEMFCPICLTTTHEAIPFDKCQHHFCPPCALAHCKNKLTQFQPVTCPIQDCQARITQQSPVYKHLTSEDKTKIQKYEQFQYVSNNPEYKACRKQECLGKIKPKKNQQVKCDKCSVEHCGTCHELKHDGKCEKDLASVLKNRQLFIECKRCKNIVQRNGGCTHMTCRCGFEFCYYCGEEFGGGHYCKGKEDCLQEIMWNINQRQHFYECSCCTFRRIFTFFRFSRADYCIEKVFKWILFMVIVYPLGIVFFLMLMILALLVGIFLTIVGPFLLIGRDELPQGWIKNKTHSVVAFLFVLLLYPVFYIFTLIFLIDYWCKNSNSNENFKGVFSGFGVFLIMPCLIIAY